MSDNPYKDWMFFLAAFATYTVVRFGALLEWPVYFFCDEAIQANYAYKLNELNYIADESFGYPGRESVKLPPYFFNHFFWNLSLSVYIQSLAAFFVEKSAYVVRAISVLVSLLAPLALALTMRDIFKVKNWYVTPLVLSILPCWFLHSRTAFETVMMVSFFSCFLYAYLKYRTANPQWLYAAIIFGAATFYAYANGQGLMGLMGLFLLIADFPYHLKQKRKIQLRGLIVLYLVLLPYIYFKLLVPGSIVQHLTVLGSYWLEDSLSLLAKIQMYFTNYFEALSYSYWFEYSIDDPDHIRHRIKDLGHIQVWFLPFIIIGLVQCFRKCLSSASHRAILFAIIAVPFSASLVSIHIPRVLAMVIPFTVLIMIAFDILLKLFSRYLNYALASLLILGTLLFGNIALAHYCIKEGPTWYNDYGLYGLQWGTREVFVKINQDLERNRYRQFNVSHSWCNNPNSLADFFIPKLHRHRVQFDVIDNYAKKHTRIPSNTVWVITHKEYRQILREKMFVITKRLGTLAYPNNLTAFHFVKLRYAAKAKEKIASIRKQKLELISTKVMLEGESIPLKHTKIDAGEIKDLFDNNWDTFIRTEHINPLILELSFPEAKNIKQIDLDLWGHCGEIGLEIEAKKTTREKTLKYRTSELKHEANPKFSFPLPNHFTDLTKLRLAISLNHSHSYAKVHIRNVNIVFKTQQ